MLTAPVLRRLVAVSLVATLACVALVISAQPAGAAAAKFPATATHKFGTTTVKAKPKRIVIVGLTEQDTVLALGYKPIATTEWYGKQRYAVWPWARKALGNAKPTVLTTADGLQFEKIANLRPDLIIGTNAGMKRGDYKKLSAIAPTVAGVKGGTDYFSRWDRQTELIASALGKRADGKALVKRVKDRYAKARAANPEFAGKTVTFTQNAFSDGVIYTYPQGLNTEFLTYLGFTISPKVTALEKKKGEQVQVSAERLSVLDADAAVFATEKRSDVKALDKVPTFRRLKVVSENRAVFTDATLSGAMYFISPLSLPYVLDRLVPQLKKAVAGTAPHRMISAR